MTSYRPRNCYCGGPEEAVYGHRYGEGQHCRDSSQIVATVTRGRLDESGALYGNTYELADGTVLHPDDVSAITDADGNVTGYLYKPAGDQS